MYEDPIINKYLTLIKDNTTDIKGFYNGLIAKIPSSMLPAVMISIETTDVDEFSNIEDEHRINLVLTYIGDIRQTFEDSALVTTLNRVIDALVGREATSSSTPYALKTTSILHIIRNNLNIDTSNNLRTDVGSVTVVTPSEIATGRFPGLFTAEGTVRFQTHYSQIR